MALFEAENLEKFVEHYHQDPLPRYSDDDIADMRDAGLDDDEIAELVAEAEQPPFEVLQQNWPAVQLYTSVYGQFRVSTNAKGHVTVLGFDLGAVETEVRFSQLEVTADTWQRFKLLQSMTVELLNQRYQSQQAHE